MKYLLGILALVGTFILINRYLPSAWKHGFTIQGYFVSAALCLMLGVCVIAYRLKGK